MNAAAAPRVFIIYSHDSAERSGPVGSPDWFKNTRAGLAFPVPPVLSGRDQASPIPSNHNLAPPRSADPPTGYDKNAAITWSVFAVMQKRRIMGPYGKSENQPQTTDLQGWSRRAA